MVEERKDWKRGVYRQDVSFDAFEVLVKNEVFLPHTDWLPDSHPPHALQTEQTDKYSLV